MTDGPVDLRAHRVRRNLAALRALAHEDPALAGRLRSQLQAEAEHEGESMAERFVDRAKAIRVDPGTLARCEALMEPVGQDPEVRAVVTRLSVSAVARLALLEGLRVLEARHGVP